MQKSAQGVFVTFEGTEGAGKSTLIRALADLARAEGWLPVLSREPGGTPVAEKIRKVILEESMDPWTELFLYEAARAEHLARTILPALSVGPTTLLLCDRFTDSSLAYQAHARGLLWKDVKALNRQATRGLRPDLTVLIDIDPAVGLARAQDQNRFEHEGVAFQSRVRKGFLKARAEAPQRWLVIRPRQATPEELAEKVMQEIRKRFGKRMKSSKRKESK